MKSNNLCPLRTHKARLLFALVALFIPLLAACSSFPDMDSNPFEAAPSPIDAQLSTATIEEYIIALPPFAYHEESVRQFKDRVMRARAEEIQNSGKGSDFLYVGGDGTWPAKEFILDRENRTLGIRVSSWEPGVNAYTETMERVPGGWTRGPRIEQKDQDSDVREHPDRWVFVGHPPSVIPAVPGLL